MAIDTKPNFSYKKFEQCATDIMNLSGCTQIYGMFDIETGATLTICNNAGIGKVLTSDASGIATWQDAATGGITSISGGSGMNFSPITTNGEIILGTPSAILNTSTNISSGTTHNHVFSASTFVTGTQGILVDGNNRFYLDDVYISDSILPDLNTVNNVTSNQSLGVLPTGQTLGMVYITNTGSTQAIVNLGTTALGNDITPFQPITVDAGEDVSVTVNMRLSLTSDTTIYINSDDWTNVGLNVQWAHVTFKNVPLPTGGTGGIPAGSDTYIQFNDNGSFGACCLLSYNDSNNSFTAGYRCGSIGQNSTVLGGHYIAVIDTVYGNVASGFTSFAWGYCTKATANYSTVGGFTSIAEGVSSLAYGQAAIAHDYSEIALGANNIISSGDSSNWVSTDNLFTIGNGIDCDNRSNALQIKKNGNLYLPHLTGCTNSDVLYYNSDDGTISYGAAPSGGSGSYSFTNGLTETSGTVKLGGILTENTIIDGDSGNYGISISGLTHYHVKVPFGGASNLTLCADSSTIEMVGCGIKTIHGGGGLHICDANTILPEAAFLGVDGDIRLCTLQAKTDETNILYIDSSTGRLASGTTTGGGASPGGLDGAMQYNNGGSFGGTSLNWDDSLNHLSWGTTPANNTMITIQSDLPYDTEHVDFIKITEPNSGYGDNFLSLGTTCWCPTLRGGYSGATGSGFDDCGLGIESISGNLGLKSRRSDGDYSSITIDNILSICPRNTFPTALTDGNIVRLSGHSTCADGLYYNNTSAWVRLDSGGTGGSPAGSDGAIQYNNGGSFGGTCLNWDDSTNRMTWNTTTQTSMLTMKKDVDYDACQTMIEFYNIDSSEVERSEFKVCLCGAAKGADMFVHCICGYCCGSTNANLELNSLATTVIGGSNVSIGATNNIGISGTLYCGIGTIANGDTTPDVSGYNILKYIGSSNITITDLDNSVVGAKYTLYSDGTALGNVTIQSTGNFLTGNSGENVVLYGGEYDNVVFLKISETAPKFIEISRSVIHAF